MNALLYNIQKGHLKLFVEHQPTVLFLEIIPHMRKMWDSITIFTQTQQRNVNDSEELKVCR